MQARCRCSVPQQPAGKVIQCGNEKRKQYQTAEIRKLSGQRIVQCAFEESIIDDQYHESDDCLRGEKKTVKTLRPR